MSLQRISSIAELKAERQRLIAEKSYAYKAIADNFTTEKDALVNKVTGTADTVRQGIMSGGKTASNSFEKWKIPALGSVAALIGVLLTTWLTGDEEEISSDHQPASGRPEEKFEEDSVSEHEASVRQAYYDEAGEEIPPDKEDFNRDAPLEERIYAAMKAFKEEESEGAQKGAFLTILGVVAPIIIKELLSGNLMRDINNILGGSVEDEMQDFSNTVADQMEAMKHELVEED